MRVLYLQVMLMHFLLSFTKHFISIIIGVKFNSHTWFLFFVICHDPYCVSTECHISYSSTVFPDPECPHSPPRTCHFYLFFLYSGVDISRSTNSRERVPISSTFRHRCRVSSRSVRRNLWNLFILPEPWSLYPNPFVRFGTRLS